MDYFVLLIVSLCLMVLYCSFSIACFIKYRKYIDPFMKSTIFCYLFAFLAKPVFWFVCLQLEDYNKLITREGQSKPLVPIRSSVAGIVSGICFLIIHIF